MQRILHAPRATRVGWLVIRIGQVGSYSEWSGLTSRPSGIIQLLNYKINNYPELGQRGMRDGGWGDVCLNFKLP